MDEKVERAAENNNVSRQVGSRIHHVTNEAFLPSGHGIAYEPTFIPPNLRPLIFGKGNGGVRVANYSVQTGEEFALQFAQEASRTKRRVELEQVPLPKANAHESNNYVYEDLTGILGIGRLDSGINSEISILGAERGNLSGYGSHCKLSYNDSLQGIQTSRSGNDGGYHLDDGSFPSTQQTGLNHPSCSMHQSYHSGLSTDSSQGKVKFMCSFGGKILPRPSDGRLRYVGGETRIITVSKDVGYEELMQKIIDVYGQALVLKYQLPGEDLDALVSVSSDEDLENMMEEYYKLDNKDGSSRLRIFLFTGSDNELTHFDVIADLRHSKQQYVDAVNGIMDMSTRKHSDSMVSFSSQHLDNLIGLDVAENWNTGRRAQEDMDSSRPQYLKDGQKIVNFPNVVPLSSKPLVCHSAFAIESLTFSAPFSSLPMHVTVKQSAVAETPMHFIQAPINLHPHSVVMPSEGIHDIDYGKPISSAAFQPDFQYTHTESKTLQDSAGNQNNDFLHPSHSDSMYKGDGRFTDTKVSQPIVDLRSDELQSVDLQRITQYRPPVHQPVWPCFVTEQYSYTPTDYVPQVNSGGVYLQHCVQQHTMQNTQSANYGTAAPKLADPVQLTHDDDVEAPQDSSLNNNRGLNTLNQVESSLNQGGVQSIAQGEQTHNTSHVDQQYISTRVLQDDNQFNGDFCPTASADSSENLRAQAVYQQGLPSNLSHPDEHFTHQQTLAQEVVTNLNERFIRPQALPHVLSDNVLQTHATKSVHIASERVSIYQGHHSDSLIGMGPSHVGPRTTQESLLSFLDQGVVGEAESKVHQDERISPTYPGWQQGKASHSSGESLKEQCLFHSNFSESLDESDNFFEQKTLEKDDKMPAARRTITDQFDSSNEEQISQLSGVDHAKPAASHGVTKPPEDINTLVSVGLDTSYEASQKTESPETLLPTSYQLKVSITTGPVGATYIVTEAMQTSQLSERINHSALPRPGSSAQEAKISIPLEEYTAHHHIGNAHAQLPTFNQRINNERLTETASNPFLTTTRVEACVPSSISGMWWDGMRSERDYTKVEASRYTCEPKGNSIDELANDKSPSIVNDMGRPQYHPAQFLGRSLIDDDFGHLYPVSGILSNARFIDNLPGSSSMHVPVSSEDGIYQRTVPLNHNISKGLFHQATADQAGSDEINESYSNDFKSNFDAMGVALDHVNLHEKLDMERKGELLNFSEMTDTLNSNFPPTSTLSDSKWGVASEDVRVDNILLEKTVEVADEDSTIIEGSILNHDSDNDEARIEDSDKDEAASDAVIAEFEAIAHGLQIIKNADLEELRELGSGTFGTVYHGKWRGSDVAIKRIKNSCFMGRPSEQERMRADFWREALMLAQMHHPNVVAFYGVVPDGPGGTLATVTEYMVNGSLKQVLQRKDRSIDRRKRLSIAMDAAFGMEYLHSKNIVHFDLKCENLLVNMRDPQRPICKVGDLGLSKIKHQTLVSGGVRGTLPWMAPELLNGSSNMVSEKVDVFSFAIVMWELLTGEEPYANMHYGAIIGGIVNNTLRPHVPNWCDPAWRTLMEQCWSADPNGRPSFTEIANRLRTMSFHSRGHGHHPHAHHG